MLRIADLIKESIVDGPGFRFVVFVQGCNMACEGCHNPDTHDLNGGYEADVENVLAMIEQNPLLDGVTLTGGEPFLQSLELARLAKACKDMGLNVVTYTGYKWEQLIDDKEALPLLEQTDFLVDGSYESEERSLNLRFRGSPNQRVIDVRRSLMENAICETPWE
jgi:anaerobic ribonucleoside-triphosphate reductase activating protein